MAGIFSSFMQGAQGKQQKQLGEAQLKGILGEQRRAEAQETRRVKFHDILKSRKQAENPMQRRSYEEELMETDPDRWREISTFENEQDAASAVQYGQIAMNTSQHIGKPTEAAGMNEWYQRNKELGRDDHASDIDKIKESLDGLGLTKEAREKVDKELKRLEQMPPLSSEAVVSRHYIDWVIGLPWTKLTKDTLSLVKAEKLLNSSHAGLTKAKERIIEFLAAIKFSGGEK